MSKDNGNSVEKSEKEETLISGNGKSEQSTPNPTQEAATPPTDFKIAEIWIRKGQLMVDASPEFWSDRVRAVGVMEYCKEIIKNAKGPEPEKPKIVVPGPNAGSVIDFVRNGLRKKK